MTTPNKEEMTVELAELVDAARRMCKLHGNLGLEYPKTDIFKAHPSFRATPQGPQQPLPSTHQAPKAQTKPAKQAAFPAQDVADLKSSIIHCERCIAEEKRTTPLWGKGKKDRPTLLIVGDPPASASGEQGRNFPEEEEILLAKMLAAINLSPEDVFLTNIIRCVLDHNEIPVQNQLQNCRPHLVEQIKLLRPLIICTMGQMASQALIGTKNKLIALRGRFHQFNDTPLMATYHPGQLLLVPDLKKAAWYDLQLIQHKLKELQKS